MVKVIPKILVLVGVAAAGVVCGVAIAERDDRKEKNQTPATEAQTA